MNIKISGGIIKKIKENKILVELEPLKPNCNCSCKCALMSLEENPVGAKIWITINDENKTKYKEGDKVFIKLLLPSTYISIILVFLLPIIGLLIGTILGNYFSNKYNLPHKDLLTLGSGVGSFIFFILVALIYDKIYQKKHHNSFILLDKTDIEEIINKECSLKIDNY